MKCVKIPKLLIMIAAIAGGLFFTGYYLFFTTRGSVFLTKKAVSNFIDPEALSISGSKGSLSQKISFHDIELRDSDWFPPGSVLKAERLDIESLSFFPLRVNLLVHQGVLKIPEMPPIFFYGNFENEQLYVNLHANNFNIEKLAVIFPENDQLPHFFGLLENIDIVITGSPKTPVLSGAVQIKELRYKYVTLAACLLRSAGLSLKGTKDNLTVKGEILVEKGAVSSDKTAVIALLPGKIVFTGNYANPVLNLRGMSTVEKVNIDITLKGTLKKPEIKLTSQPPFSQERLLIMLATGKKWKGADNLAQNEVTADLAADFIDYIIFSGRGAKMAEKLGISEFSLRLDKKTKGVTLKKEISDKTAISYGLEKTTANNTASSSAQSLGGEYKITDSVSIEVERKTEQNSGADSDKSKTQDDRFILQYKRKF